jgi:hypothetical protein
LVLLDNWLSLRPRTAHGPNILIKLHIANRTQAAKLARERGLISHQESYMEWICVPLNFVL